MTRLLAPHEPPYLVHFGLRNTPFRRGPLPEGFFNTASRSAMLDDMAMALAMGDTMVALTGERGAGKTTLSRMLIHREASRTRFLHVADPNLDPDGLYRCLARELDLPDLGAGLVMSEAIGRVLASWRTEGWRTALVVDDAHELPDETLAQIAYLGDLERGDSPLLQTILIGSSALETRRIEGGQGGALSLQDRLVQRFEQPVFDDTEGADFIGHEIERAGGLPTIFPGPVRALINSHAQGVVQRLNVLAARSLLMAWRAHATCVSIVHVHQALADVTFEFERYPSRRSLRQSIGLWKESRSFDQTQVH